MSRTPKRTKRIILLHCEGKSEAAYFQRFAEKLNQTSRTTEGCTLDVYPIVRIDEEPSVTPVGVRKPRPVQNTEEVDYAPNDQIEEEFWRLLNPTPPPKKSHGWTQPTNYVKLARDRIKEISPDEAWVVFDTDGHPKIKEAFDFAAKEVNGITISVAFSKLSFEYWKLLHFEFAAEVFNYTQHHTKVPPAGHQWQGRKGKGGGFLVPCGKMAPEAIGFDCKGMAKFSSAYYHKGEGPCLIGRLEERGYLKGYLKGVKSSDFETLFQRMEVAIARAEILRAKLSADFGALKAYEYPYFTNLDTLILSIAKGHPGWSASKEAFYIRDSTPIRMGNGIIVKAGLKGAQLTLEVTNNGQITIAEQDFKSISPLPQQNSTGPLSLLAVGKTAKITFTASTANDLLIIRYKDTLIGVAIDQFQSSLPDDSAGRT